MQPQILESTEKMQTELLHEVHLLRKELQSLKINNETSEKNAESIIRRIVARLNKGRAINIISLISETRLPAEQINKIMTKLQNEGVVSEDD